MNISNSSSFIDFISKLKDAKGRDEVKSLIAELRESRSQSKDRVDDSDKGERGHRARRGHRPPPREEIVPDTPPVGTTVEPETPVVESPVQADSLTDLAELYVKQYEEGSGTKLSSEAFEQKKVDIVNLYSRLGKDRLDEIVFANDVDVSA